MVIILIRKKVIIVFVEVCVIVIGMVVNMFV